MINIVILAAGKGTRMRSKLPKVLHSIAGRPMLGHVLQTISGFKATNLCVVVGHGADQVKGFAQTSNIAFTTQNPQLGTGHALQLAAPHLNEAYHTLVLYGDVPLIQLDTLQRLIQVAAQSVGVLTVNMNDPTGYGRIKRNLEGSIQAIVEHKDASETDLLINEVNTGILIAPTTPLKKWLSQLSNDNVQKEYLLTDIIGFAVEDGFTINSTQPTNDWETFGVNDKTQLAALEAVYRAESSSRLLEQGVTLIDPLRTDLRGSITCGMDVCIDVGCIFEGDVHIHDDVTIGPYCVIKNTTIGAGTHIAAFTHIDGAVIGSSAKIGPFARLRPETQLANQTHIGNFVEIKKSTIATASKVNHLSYIGDAIVGQNVNIGAGVITCNYDGVNKHTTTIGDNAFIGSDTQLVAPVTVGANSTIGAGSTITKNTPNDTLTLSRGKQISLASWQRPSKK